MVVLDEVARVEALQTALEGEHAAVFLYRVGAGPLRSAQLERARGAIDVHRARRDALVRLVELSGAVPIAAEATYPVPVDAVPDGTPPRTKAQARAVLHAVESGLVDAYVVLAAAGDAETHDLAVEAQLDSERRAKQWAPAPTTTTSAPTAP